MTCRSEQTQAFIDDHLEFFDEINNQIKARLNLTSLLDLIVSGEFEHVFVEQLSRNSEYYEALKEKHS